MWQIRDEHDLNNWKVTNDSDHNEGQSFSTFEISPAGHGLFSGHVRSNVPLDGRIKRAGYSNITTMRARVNSNSIETKRSVMSNGMLFFTEII